MELLYHSFLRNLHIVFHSGWTDLHAFQKCTRVSCILANIFICVFYDNSHSDKYWVYFIVVLIFISLINYVEHLFMCLFAISVSPFKKCLFGSYDCLSIGFFYIELYGPSIYFGY